MKKILVLLICIMVLSGCSGESLPLAKDDLFVFSDGRRISSLRPEDNIDFSNFFQSLSPVDRIVFSEERAPMGLETKRGLQIGDSVDKCKKLYAGLPCIVTEAAVADAYEEPDFNKKNHYYMKEHYCNNIGTVSLIAGKYTVCFLWACKDDILIDTMDLLDAMIRKDESSLLSTIVTEDKLILLNATVTADEFFLSDFLVPFDELFDFLDPFDEVGMIVIEFEDGYVSDIAVSLQLSQNKWLDDAQGGEGPAAQGE